MTKTHSEQTTPQSHAIVFHALTQPVMHVKNAGPLSCQGNKAKINNIREYLAKISPKDH